VLNNLAWLLATSPDDAIRDGARAIELATKACEETEWKQAHIVSTLAAGYAEAGDFAKAREYSQKAVDLGGESDEVKQQLKSELASYEAEKPWRERQEVAEAKPEGDASDLVLEAVQEAEQPAQEPGVKRKPRRPFDE
jgi:lipopolysaccharide biosynthesis regulator YciM